MAKREVVTKRDNVLAIEDLYYSYKNATGEQKILKGINAEFHAG